MKLEKFPEYTIHLYATKNAKSCFAEKFIDIFYIKEIKNILGNLLERLNYSKSVDFRVHRV